LLSGDRSCLGSGVKPLSPSTRNSSEKVGQPRGEVKTFEESPKWCFQSDEPSGSCKRESETREARNQTNNKRQQDPAPSRDAIREFSDLAVCTFTSSLPRPADAPAARRWTGSPFRWSWACASWTPQSHRRGGCTARRTGRRTTCRPLHLSPSRPAWCRSS